MTPSQLAIADLKAKYVKHHPSTIIPAIDAIEANQQTVDVKDSRFARGERKYWRKYWNAELKANCSKCDGLGYVWVLDLFHDVVPEVCNRCQGGFQQGQYPTADDVTEVSF